MHKQEFVPSEIAIFLQYHMISLEVSFRIHAKSYCKTAFSKKSIVIRYFSTTHSSIEMIKKTPGVNLLMSNIENFTTLNIIYFHGFV